jgi:aspartyl-tRNA(Asn)/glutamyl-tRNA(Gln) amidotransferase subunit C
MSISREEVLQVARLARLAMTGEEADRLREQLSAILDSMKELDALDTTGVEPTAHAVSLGTPFREDAAVPFGDREALLANAPDRSGDFFRVPRIIED